MGNQTKIDKLHLNGLQIIEIEDNQMLEDMDVLRTSASGYTITIKDTLIKGLDLFKRGFNKFKTFCYGQFSVADESTGNLHGLSVDEYRVHVAQKIDEVKDKYGITVSTAEAEVRAIELNKTFSLAHDFKDYHRVLDLIIQKMPKLRTRARFDTAKSRTIYGKTTTNARAKEGTTYVFYDKSAQMDAVLHLSETIARFEVKLKGTETIKKAFGTDKFKDLKQKQIDEFFEEVVFEKIIAPMERQTEERKKHICKIIKEERKKGSQWVSGVLRRLSNEEIEQGYLAVMDLQELYDCIDMMDIDHKSRVKGYFQKESANYEKYLCRNDGGKLDEILDKLSH